ncbi:MAG: hypothetical protein A2Y40_06500 [Candidatus Margulisbacteria bacterium GWF2_35_9]|nr:MAG: hypothetical protein A2Y40_06500 [Candidatus Margulisbacteria bacterium GWF2_35_9]
MNIKINSAYIEIINICNLNCNTCYNRSGLNNIRKEISYGQFDLIINRLLELGCTEIVFSGGEPFLHSEIDKIALLTEKYPSLRFCIITNGTIFNENIINTYINTDNLSFQISLDGSCEEINKKTRGTNNFGKTVKLIDELRKHKKKMTLKMVISQLNISDVENFYLFSLNKGIKPSYAFISRAGNGEKDWEQKCLTATQKLSVIKLIDKLNKEYKLKVFPPLCTSNCPLDDTESEMQISIKVDGSILPCQLLYDSKYSIGNIFNFSLDEFESNLLKIAAINLERKNIDYGCSKCIIRSHCKKGCMAVAYFISNDPLGNDGDCEFRKLQFIGYDLKNQLKKVEVYD